MEEKIPNTMAVKIWSMIISKTKINNWLRSTSSLLTQLNFKRTIPNNLNNNF